MIHGILALMVCVLTPQPGEFFKIEVVDQQTGRGIPMVELETVNNVCYLTDSNGIVAFYEPGLMNGRVFFHVRSHGYEFPKDGFGYHGKALQIKPGGNATLKMRRINIAQRLYRVTGQGIYRDSVLLGQPVPIEQPLLNGLVFGSDSVVSTIYRGKIYWFWGDTNRPGYPLGNFHVPGATSKLPAAGGLDPAKGIDLDYFVDEKGFARPTAELPGKGPTWIDALVTLPDRSGQEQMLAKYVKIRNWLEVYERGLVRFNDETKRFEKLAALDMNAPVWPAGHPFRHTTDNVEHVYFATPYPLTRVRAMVEDYRQPAHYKAFTCLREGSRLDDPKLDRAADGSLRYGWKKNTPAVGPADQAKLIKAGKLKPAEAWLQLIDHATGKPVLAHRGSVAWNDYRKRWVMIATQSGGETSQLGEVWYAEADAPVGPWIHAAKIVTHDQYTFYNPKQHPMFDQDGGRTVFFEGTYSHTFSGNPDQTPRYDYNQIMYGLDLTDPRLILPVAVYRLSERIANEFATRVDVGHLARVERIAFFALDRPREKTVPVYRTVDTRGHAFLTVGRPSEKSRATVAFHALSRAQETGPRGTVPLHEFVATDGRRTYSTDSGWSEPGFRRADRPLAWVWPNPLGKIAVHE